jgi:hypothetical protein
VEISSCTHATASIYKKLALTSPTCGGRAVGIDRSRTKVTELLLLIQNNRNGFEDSGELHSF